MRHSLVFAAALSVALGAAPALADTAKNTTDSRAAVKTFFGQLKGELVAALKSGGPVNAISACNAKAPAIAAHLSEKKGWSIGRTSLKLRNLANAPDAWEKKVLEDFEARKAKGESPKGMEFAEVVEQGGEKVFRYMSAIPTAEKPCLACHGEKIDAKVTAALDSLYPGDQARGYKAGDIRGAFTISFPAR